MALKEAGQRGTVVQGRNGEVFINGATGVPEIEYNRKNKDLARLLVYVTGLEHPFTGYFPTQSGMGKLLIEFAEKEQMITILFEQKRKKDVDKNIPITELKSTPEKAKESTVKVVGGIYDWKDEKWILADETTLALESIPVEWTQELVKRSTEFDFVPETFVPEVKLPKPVVSYSVEENFLLINYYMFVKDMEIKYDYELTDERRRLVARKLLTLANGIQQKTTGIQVPNYKDYSHTKSRGLVFQIIERFYPLDSSIISDEGLNNILKLTLDKALDLLSWQ